MILEKFNFINFDYLDSLIDGDLETKQVILSTLLDEVPEEIEKLNSLIQNQNWHDFHEVSHKLKSTLAYIGNDTIFDANQNMMMASRNETNLGNIPAWFEIVQSEWANIEPELIAALEQL
jgi:HPt (histidine-containing phosphotransfer) domain-containing protein